MGDVLRLGAGLLMCAVGCRFTPGDISAGGDARWDAAGDAFGDGPASDTGPIDGPAIDGPLSDVSVADAPAGCVGFLAAVGGTFVVEAQPQLNSADNDRDPSLSPDGLSLFLASGRSGGLGGQDIWEAGRTDPADAFGAPAHRADLSSNLGDTRTSFAPDFRTVYLGSTRAGGAGLTDVWRGTRSSTADPFGAFTVAPFSAVNTMGDDHDPAISFSERNLYLAQVSALGDQDIVVATRPSPSFAFGAPVTVPVINSPQGDADPTLTPDERVIMFGSSRPGGPAASNIWYAIRATTDVPFSPPVLVPGVNGDADDGDPMLSADGCELYFASDRAGGLGSRDVWRARFQP